MEDRKLIRLIQRNPEKGISIALDLYGSSVKTICKNILAGQTSMIVELETSSYMNSLEGTLTLTNLVQFAGSTNIIQEGKWEIDVAVNCNGVMRTFETDETIIVDGVVMDIGSIDISPISFYLHELRVTEEGSIPDEDWWMNNPITSINVVMKNGDEVVIVDRHQPWATMDDGSQWAEIQGDPYGLIDVDEVAGLSFDGQIVELK